MRRPTPCYRLKAQRTRPYFFDAAAGALVWLFTKQTHSLRAKVSSFQVYLAQRACSDKLSNPRAF